MSNLLTYITNNTFWKLVQGIIWTQLKMIKCFYADKSPHARLFLSFAVGTFPFSQKKMERIKSLIVLQLICFTKISSTVSLDGCAEHDYIFFYGGSKNISQWCFDRLIYDRKIYILLLLLMADAVIRVILSVHKG